MQTPYQVELNQALKEAMASPDYGKTITYDTIQLFHSEFVDNDGNPTPVYVYRGNQYGAAEQNDKGYTYITAGIEPEASINAGKMVEFIAAPLSLILPEEGELKRGNFKIKVSGGVSHLNEYIKRASGSNEEVEMIFRKYISTDMSLPAQVDIGAALMTVEIKGNTIIAEGEYYSFLNYPFGKIYSKIEWPRLVGA